MELKFFLSIQPFFEGFARLRAQKFQKSTFLRKAICPCACVLCINEKCMKFYIELNKTSFICLWQMQFIFFFLDNCRSECENVNICILENFRTWRRSSWCHDWSIRQILLKSVVGARGKKRSGSFCKESWTVRTQIFDSDVCNVIMVDKEYTLMSGIFFT